MKPGTCLAILLTLTVALTATPPFDSPRPTQGRQQLPIVLQASLVLDGRGQVLRDTSIVVQGSKVTEINPQAHGVTYDLRGLFVLPGWIDTHVHSTAHFGPNGRAADKQESPAQAALASAANAYATLMQGFTTVQSIGAPEDRDLRDFVARDQIPGPRMLTSLQPITERTGTPAELRQAVERLAASGADVVKIFASKSIREGGGPTLTVAQLEAACGEAKARGLRTLVHAHSSESVRAAALAGCSQVEHGLFATADDLRLMAERGVYFDPQVGLVFHNYFENKARFLGVGNYTEEGFAAMARAMPLAIELFRRALATPNLKVVFGTDAVAGAHGRNAEEFLYRVRDAGEPPMHALISATSLAAQSLGLGQKLGTLAPGYEADIIALEGNPLEDITAVRRVVFVMKGGKIYKNLGSSAAVK